MGEGLHISKCQTDLFCRSFFFLINVIDFLVSNRYIFWKVMLLSDILVSKDFFTF